MKPYDLIFGILACQLRLVPRAPLVHLADALGDATDTSLVDKLQEEGHIASEDHALLLRLVDNIIHAHHGDERAALNAFGGEDAVRNTFSRPLESGDNFANPRGRTILATDLPHGLPLEIAPEPVGRYTGGSEYARGGIGRILLVHDEQIGRDVILKELLPNLEVNPSAPTLSRLPGGESPGTPMRHSAAMMARFLQEAKITGQLEHPSIVPVYELGLRNDGQLYYTMKLVRGKTMAVAIDECKTKDDRLALLRPFLDMCQAMAYAHSKGVIHRDLKPSNVMVGEFGECVVLDWGLAKSGRDKDAHQKTMEKTISQLNIPRDKIGDVNTRANDVLGTPLYMSPEQARAETEGVGPFSDVYSLGVVLYEILTGDLPHVWTNTLDTIRRVGIDKAPSVRIAAPDTPPELVAICDKALQFDAKDRYSSAKELTRDLRHFLEGAVVDAYAYKVGDILRRLYRQHKILINATLTATLIVMLIGIVSYVNIYNAGVIAKRERAIADEQRLRAENAKEAADKQRQRAEIAEERTAQEKYVSDIRLADTYLRDYEFQAAEDTLLNTDPRYRNIEWGYMIAQCNQEMAILAGHKKTVFVKISHDGNRILTISADKSAKLWNAETDEVLFTWDLPGSFANFAAFSPDDTRVAVWLYDGSIHLFDTSSDERMGTISAHAMQITNVDFSGTGQFLVSAGDDGLVRVWNLGTLALAVEIDTETNPGTRAVFANNDTRVLVVPAEGSPRLYDSTSGNLVKTTNNTGHVKYTGEGKIIVADGKQLTLLSAEDLGELWRTEIGDEISNVKYFPENDLVLGKSSDGMINLWKGSDGQSVLRFYTDTTIKNFRLDHSGARIIALTTSGRFQIFNASNGDLIEEFGSPKGHTTNFDLAPDNQFLLTGSADGIARKWSLNAPANVATVAWAPPEMRPTSFSEDGRFISLAAPDGLVQVLDLNDGTVVFQAKLLLSPNPRNLTLSADGTLLATVLDRFLPVVISLDDGAIVSTLRGHEGYINSIRFSPDGNQVVTGSADQTTRVWNTRSGAQEQWFAGHSGNVNDAVPSENGSWLVSASSDNKAIVWDRRSGLPHFTIKHANKVQHCAFSMDSSLVATVSTDNDIQVWDVKSARRNFRIMDKFADANVIGFNTDISRLIANDRYANPVIWDARSGDLLVTPTNSFKQGWQWQHPSGGANLLTWNSYDGSIRQQNPLLGPSDSPVLTQMRLDFLLRSQRKAQPVAKRVFATAHSTTVYLPTPTTLSLIQELQKRYIFAANGSAPWILESDIDGTSPLKLERGDTLVAFNSAIPGTFFDETKDRNGLDGAWAEKAPLRIDLIRDTKIQSLVVFSLPVSQESETLMLSPEDALSALEATRNFLAMYANTVREINQREYSRRGFELPTQGENILGLWIPEFGDNQETGRFRPFGLQPLARITQYHKLPLPSLSDIGTEINSGIQHLESNKSFEFRLRVERGSFDRLEVTVKSKPEEQP